MRAVVLTGYGGVEKLELQEVSEPEAGPGAVKVRLAATSVNPIDWKLRSGAYRTQRELHFPAILGRDASGEVVATGPGASKFRIGARVLGLVNEAYAQYVVAPEGAWAELPESLNAIDAAALPLAALTGTQLIEEAVRPRPGEVVLVLGALGSVGRAAVFAARSRGAEVVAGVRGKQKELARALEVDVVAIDDEAEVKRLPRVDAIADTLGGDAVQKLLGKVKPGGTVGSVLGEPSGARAKGLAVRAHLAHPDSGRLAALAESAAAGKLIIPIARRMPLAQVREAHTLAEKGVGGKIILQIG